MTVDHRIKAYKNQISKMMYCLRLGPGDVAFVDLPDVKPFESIYCNVEGNLFGFRNGSSIPVKPTAEIYSRVHSSLIAKCKRRIDERRSRSNNFHFLGLLIKTYYKITFIDLE